MRSFDMSLPRSSLCPLIVTRDGEQTALSSRFESREDEAVIRGYGALLVEMCSVVPDGVICFFVSYTYMENIVSSWADQGIIDKLRRNKLVYIETKVRLVRKSFDCFSSVLDIVVAGVAVPSVAAVVAAPRRVSRPLLAAHTLLLLLLLLRYTVSRVSC